MVDDRRYLVLKVNTSLLASRLHRNPDRFSRAGYPLFRLTFRNGAKGGASVSLYQADEATKIFAFWLSYERHDDLPGMKTE
jgi:hypothetical protein